MKAFIKTYGCQMNEQDSLQMKGLLSRMGYDPAADPEDADLILLTTCSIREKAVHKVYSDLGRLRPLVDENPNRIIGLAGCVAQQEKANLCKRFPFLDLVFGPDAISELPSMVTSVLDRRKQGNLTALVNTRFHSRQDFQFVNLIAENDENRVKAYVTIQKGCDNVCAFCIVPAVRGAEVSRPSDDIVKEVQSLIELGVKEVTLLGQNVNSYGKKNPREISFARLIRRIAEETQLKRLRFTSSHPQDVTTDLIQQYSELEVLCSHFHLPVQSGSDRILTAMRRDYKRYDYLKIIEALRRARPDIALSTDIIVGFPGETEEDFRQTLDLMQEVGFDMSYSFVYSPRPGTRAAKLADDVLKDEKARRLESLMNLQTEIARKKNDQLKGTIVEVLVEKEDDLGHNLMGRTGTNKIIHFPIPAGNKNELKTDWIGRFVQVKINQANPYSLVGEVLT